MPSQVEKLDLTGLATDLPPYQYPPNVWTRGENVEMGEGFPRRARGYARVFGATLDVPRWLVNVREGTISHFVYGADTTISATDGVTHDDITGALAFDSTGQFSPWTGGVLNQRAILNNKAGPAASWVPGAAAAIQLPDWPTTRVAGAMRVYREFLVALDITEIATRDPDLIRWSDAAPPNDVPQSWTVGSGSQAGSASAAFTAGPLVDGLTLREQFYIYKQHATYVLSLTGGAFVMQQRPVFSTLGALARNCVVEYRGSHIVLTDGDVVMHDGTQARSLVDRVVRNAIFDNIDGDNFENSFVVLDKTNSEVWVCIPTTGNVFPNFAAVLSIADNKWGLRDLGVNTWPHGIEGIVSIPLSEPTWASRTTTWINDASLWRDTGSSPARESVMFADAGSLLQSLGQSNTFDGSEPTALLERTGLDLGLPDRYKYVTRIWPKVSGTNGSTIQIRAGGQAHAEGPIDWDVYRDFVIGTDESVPVDARGRFIAVGLRSLTSGEWRAPSFDVEVREMGGY